MENYTPPSKCQQRQDRETLHSSTDSQVTGGSRLLLGVGVDLGLEQLGKTQQVIPILKANRHHATQNYCSKNTAVNGQQVVAWLSHAYSSN